MKKLILLLLFLCAPAFADTGYKITAINNITQTIRDMIFTSGQAACDWGAVYVNYLDRTSTTFWATYYSSGGSSGWCGYGGLNPQTSFVSLSIVTYTPTTTTTTTTTTACPGVASEIDLGWPVGYVGSDGRPVGGLNIPPMGTHVAFNGCAYSLGNLGTAGCTSNPSQPVPRLVTCSYKANGLGRAAAGGDAVPTTPTAPNVTPDNGSCPKGTISGGVDSAGIPICIGEKTASDPNTGKETTSKPPPVTNGDGSITESEVKERTNADGSKTTTTTTTTTGMDGSKSVDVSQSTSKSPLGETGAADETTDFCQKNPQLTICKNSTVSGSCESVSCSGDAIQCEILRKASAKSCQDKQDRDELLASSAYSLGNAVLSGNDPQAGSLPGPNNAQTINVGTLEANGWLGGGSCFADKQFTIQGNVISIPFSSLCQYLIVFRYIIMIIAALVSYRMLSGVFLRD